MRGSVCLRITSHQTQTPTDNEYHPATGLGALGWARSGDHPSHNRLGSSGALESGGLETPGICKSEPISSRRLYKIAHTSEK
jgi:hypothetical protein